VLMVIFGLASDRFFSLLNMANLVVQAGPICLLAMGLVFWFLILRPQSQARKKQAALLNALKKGDDVMTVGGIVGIVKDIKEVGGETRVTVESGTSTVVVERSRIIRVGNASSTGTAAPV